MTNKMLDAVAGLSMWLKQQNLERNDVKITFKTSDAAKAFRWALSEHTSIAYPTPEISMLFGIEIDDSAADFCPKCGRKQ
jgi:hypothetical protein